MVGFPRCLRGAILLAAIACAPAVETELRLTTGEVVRGEVTSQTDTEVALKRAVPGKDGVPIFITVRYPRGQIAAITEVSTAADEYPAQAKAAATTADGQAALARWCVAHQLRTEAITHAKRALALDQTHTLARQAMADLGLVEREGEWLDQDEALKRQGLERVGDKIMSVAAAKAHRDLGQATFARNQAEAAAREATRKSELADKLCVDFAASLQALEKEQAQLEKSVKEIPDRLDKAKLPLILLKQRLDEANAAVQREIERNGAASVSAQNSQATAQKDYDQEKKPYDELAKQLAEGQKRLEAFTKDLPLLKTKETELKQKRDQLAAAQVEAKTKLLQSQKAAEELQAEFKKLTDEVKPVDR
jgi:DNA repair exonuclease SbcCD ATPase subunit